MTFKNTIRLLLILFICFSLIGLSNFKARSSQAIVPLNITVQGKLVITDANNDNRTGYDPTLNVRLHLIPDLYAPLATGSSSIRIRTNLSNWKLTAQRSNVNSSTANIDPGDISLSFTTQAGTKANPNAGKLLPPFDTQTNLSRIATASPTDILKGNSKTSIDKDPENKNNWFQLTSNYSISPDFFFETGEWNTVVSYNLVSP